MAAPWDILGKAANLVQLLGLEAFTLITIIMSFLRLCEIEKECRKLEERVRLLQWIMTQQQQQHLELGDLVRDAQGLVASYNESMLFLRIWRGRSMVRQFQDLYTKINYYCDLILTANACLLIGQANPPPPLLVVRPEVNDGDMSPSSRYSTDAASTASHDTHIINGSQE